MDVRLPDGTIISNVPDDITRAALTERLARNGYDVSGLGAAPAQPEKPAAVSAGQAINSIPRQLGLTARYALEGPAEAAQIVTEPVRNFITDPLLRATGVLPSGQRKLSDLVTGAEPKAGASRPLGQVASSFADWLGLPKPEGANERVVADATKLVAGGGGVMGVGRAARALPGMVGQVGAALAANPAQQLASAAGAGAAAGASREADGGVLMQAGAGLLGGLAGGMAPSTGQALLNTGKRLLMPAQTNAQIDAQISRAFATRDIDYSTIPESVKQALRTELRASLQAGKEVNPDALSRLADFRAVGATPTRGMISQDPVQITREQNLAKMAANTGDDALHGLPRLQNQNNRALIGRLNDLGGRTETDPLAAGRLLASRVQGTQAGLRSAETEAWSAAKASPGYRQPIAPDALNAINRELGDTGMMAFMPKPITDYMAAFQTGQQPFTPQAYRNLQSMLSNEMAKGGNEAAAAGIARRVLEATPMRPITNAGGRDFGSTPITAELAAALRAHDAQPDAAIGLVDRARAATRAAYQYEDSSPLVRSVLSDGASADPARVAQRFVINGTPDEAATVAREVGPQGIGTIRDALATHIKRQALSGAPDEVGKVSQSRLNAAIRSIGEEKLRLFFSPEEVAQLRSASRVASLMQSQPVGSAVNNSNSGALVLGRGADLLGGLARRLPMGQQLIAEPLQNINVSLSQRQAENLLPGLLLSQPRPGAAGLLAPGVAMGGLLAAPMAP